MKLFLAINEIAVFLSFNDIYKKKKSEDHIFYTEKLL